MAIQKFLKKVKKVLDKWLCVCYNTYRNQEKKGVIKMRTFEIIHRPTGKEYEVVAASYADACKSLGIKITECRLVWACWKPGVK